MTSFSVTSVIYDGSSGDRSPLVTVQGSVNGVVVWIPNIFWAAIQQAYIASPGSLQQLLGWYMLSRYQQILGNFLYIPPPPPVFPSSSNFPAPLTGNVAYKNAICTQALTAPWSA